MTSTASRSAARGRGVDKPSSRKLVPPTPRPRIALPPHSSSSSGHRGGRDGRVSRIRVRDAGTKPDPRGFGRQSAQAEVALPEQPVVRIPQLVVPELFAEAPEAGQLSGGILGVQ